MPQVYSANPVQSSQDAQQLVDPDGDPLTNDQLIDSDETARSTGSLTYPILRRQTIDDGKSFIDGVHLAGLQFTAEHVESHPANGAFFDYFFFDENCDTTTPASTNLHNIPDWTIFRFMGTDYCQQTDDGPFPADSCTMDDQAFSPSLCLFKDTDLAESIRIAPASTGSQHSIVTRGQKLSGNSDTLPPGVADPIPYWELSDTGCAPFPCDAEDKAIDTVRFRVDYWDQPANTDPTYGSSEIDRIFFDEFHLQWAELFDPTAPPAGGSKYVVDLIEPRLYFNSSTFGATALQDFQTYCAGDSACQLALCGSGDPACQQLLFPVLPTDMAAGLGARCTSVDPQIDPLYWDWWMRWRYHVMGSFYARYAAQVSGASTNSPVGCGIFTGELWYPLDRLFQAVNPAQPTDRRWLYSPSENRFPNAGSVPPYTVAADSCKPTVYVDDGLDPATVDAEFRKLRQDLEWYVIEMLSSGGGNLETTQMALYALQERVNEVNRLKGDVTGADRSHRTKTATLFGLRHPPGQGGPLPLRYPFAFSSQTSSPGQPETYQLDIPRTALAQLMNCGMDGVSMFEAGQMLKDDGAGNRLRTPYYSMWRAMHPNLTEEKVQVRTVNANLLENGSFESKNAVAATPFADAWTASSSTQVTLEQPASQPFSFQGDRHARIAAGQSVTSDFVMVEPGDVFRCSAWARRQVGPTSMTLRIQFSDGVNPPTEAVLGPTAVASGAWGTTCGSKPCPFELIAAAPATAVEARVVCEATVGTLEVDNIWLQDVTAGRLDAPNYMENGSFEFVDASSGGPASWMPSGDPLLVFARATGPLPRVPLGGGAFASIQNNSGVLRHGAWISDRIFADGSETYDTLSLYVRSAGLSGSGRASIRWYDEAHDFDDGILREDFIGGTVTGSDTTWNSRTITNQLFPPQGAVFARIYLAFDASAGRIDFDVVKLHGIGPEPHAPAYWTGTGSGQPCDANGAPTQPTVDFAWTIEPLNGPLPVVVKLDNLSQNATDFSWVDTNTNGGNGGLNSTTASPVWIMTGPPPGGNPWHLQLTAKNGDSAPATIVHDIYAPSAGAAPTLVSIDRQAGDPTVGGDPLHITGTGFRRAPSFSDVRFIASSFSGTEFSAMESNVTSATDIEALTPICLYCNCTPPCNPPPPPTKVEDPGPTSLVLVRNPDTQETTSLPFTFTYRPFLDAIALTVEPGSFQDFSGHDFLESQASDETSVLFAQGTRTFEEPATVNCLGDCQGTSLLLTTTVPSALTPGVAATVQARKVRSYGLNDRRLSAPRGISVDDTHAPRVIDRYPEPDLAGASFLGAASNTEIYVTVADSGRGVDRNSLSMSVNGSAVPFKVLPDCYPQPCSPSASSYTLLYRPPAPFPYPSTVQVTVLANDGQVFLVHSFQFAITSGVSSDGDSIPDDWESAHFPNDANLPSYGNDTDCDNDGSKDTRTNLREFQRGTNPDSIARIINGPGGRQENPSRVLLYSRNDCSTGTLWNGLKSDPLAGFAAYSAPYGVNVATGEVDADGFDEVLTGAGYGPVNGPQVRAFEIDSKPFGKVNFFAYGTLKYGVNVAGAELDDATRDEILTSPGPGVVFGPHIRGWSTSSGRVTAMQKVTFFAYNALKYGANVSAGDIDGDSFEEILTGPGPGPAFGAQVRGWNCDNMPVTAIGKVNFLAYGGTYGVRVGAGDIDARSPSSSNELPGLYDEIVTGRGPGPSLTPQVRAFNYDGVTLTPIQKINFYAFPSFDPYGVNVASGGDLDGTWDGRGDEIVATQGTPAPELLDQDRRYLSEVKAYSYDGTGSLKLAASYVAFDTQGYVGGCRAALGHFDEDNQETGLFRSDQALISLRSSIASVPDGTGTDPSLDPGAIVDRNEWVNPATKTSALATVDGIVSTLPSMTVPQLLDQLGGLSGMLTGAFLNPDIEGSVQEQVAAILVSYQGAPFTSAANVARASVGEAARNASLTIEGPRKLDVTTATEIKQVDVDGSEVTLLPRDSQSMVPAQPLDVVVVPAGATRVTASEAFAVSATMVTVGPQVQMSLYLQDVGGDGTVHQRFLLSATQNESAPGTPVTIGDMIVTPNGTGYPSGRVYISGAVNAGATTSPPNVIGGFVLVVNGVDNVETATVAVISNAANPYPLYTQLALSPDPADSRIAAVQPNAVDAIKTTTTTIKRNALPFGGSGVATVRTSAGVNVAIVADSVGSRLRFVRIADGVLLGDVPLPNPPSRVAVTPDGALAVASGPKVAVVDVNSMMLLRSVDTGAPTYDLAPTPDGSLAYGTIPVPGKVVGIYLQPARVSTLFRSFGNVVLDLPDGSFAQPPSPHRNGMRDHVSDITAKLAELESMPPGPSRDSKVTIALEKLQTNIVMKMDGSLGGDPGDDFITDPNAQRLLVPLAKEVQIELEALYSTVTVNQMDSVDPMSFPDETPDDLSGLAGPPCP